MVIGATSSVRPSGLRQYRWITIVSSTLLILDLLINSAFLLYSQSVLISLLLYIIQDVCVIFSIILLTVASFSTSYSKVGLMRESLGRLKCAGVGSFLYLGLCVSLHTLTLQHQWSGEGEESLVTPSVYVWNDPMLALFSIQRIVAAIHYYLFKRTVFKLADGKLYL